MVKSTAFADERGMSLVETLVTVAIVAMILAAFLAAISVGSFGVSVVRERVTAENLARAQLEYIKNYTYTVGATSDYFPIIEHPEDYPITIDISYWYSATGTFSIDPSDDDPGCCGMQWITVTVSHNGEPVFTVVDYKLSR
jgi:prepilin-type N-terminal cleavage/methylation domain-containing protein